MTCHDARELFSALIDERLSREERADVYGHLATCPECRRELTALEQTVALVRRTAPARAPAGFVDRVVTAVRPIPWYVRAARAVFLPWPVKLPLEAAAVVLVAGLAVLLFRGSQEVRRAAYYQEPSSTESRVEEERAKRELSAAKSAAENKTAEPEAPAAVPPAVPAPSAPSSDAQSSATSSERATAPGVAVTTPAPTSTPDLAGTPPRRADDAGAAVSRQERQQAPAQATGERDSMKDAYTGTRAVPPVAQAPVESRERSVMAKVQAPPPADVVARLTAPDPATAARAVAALAARLAGAETARRTDGDALVVELVIPRERYADFTREVARLGDYRAEAEPATLPEPVRLAVRLAR
jgi:hypothetical protein